MKLKLHIGTEKTGTTTLQSFLSSNRQILLNKGYLIPRSIGVGNNRALVSCAMGDNNFDDYHSANQIFNLEQKLMHDKNIIELLKSEIAENPNVHTVIISSEHFHSRLVHIDEINKLYQILSGIFTSIEVYVYLRPQIEVATSLYSTVLRAGSKLKLNDFLKSNLRVDNRYYRYDILLNEWAEAFGKENLYPKVFSRGAFVNQDLIDDLIFQLGLDEISNLKKVINVNESLNLMGQEFYRASNLNSDPMTRKPYHLLEGYFTGKGAMPNKKDAELLQGAFNESNDKLFIKWFRENDRFQVDFSKYNNGNELTHRQENLIHELFNNTKIEENEINCLRDIAVDLEKYNLNFSLKLMRIANKYRPSGRFIKTKLEKYIKELK